VLDNNWRVNGANAMLSKGYRFLALLAVAGLAGCVPDPPSCGDPMAISLLKQLAVGRSKPVSGSEKGKIDRFLEVTEIATLGRFGARENCSASLAISAEGRAALGSSWSGDQETTGPVHVDYDIILPMDQSTVSVVVVELKQFDIKNEQTFSSAYSSLPESFGVQATGTAGGQ